jgi:signal transduction histidine kinase
MLRAQPARFIIGVACVAGTVVFVASIYRYTGAPLPFLFLIPIFVAALLGGRTGGIAALLAALLGTYYYTEPVGWHMTPSGAISIVVFASASCAIIEAIARMQQAIRVRETLLSMASHDIRTPLSSMMLHEELLLSGQEGGSAPSAERLPMHAHAMLRLNAQITFIIDNLLNLARIDSGRLRIEKKEADLAPHVRALIDRLGPQFAACGSACSARGLDEKCLGSWDVFVVEQVLMNLLTNAIKYGNGQPIHVALEQEAGRVRLVVEDRGVGIAPREQRRLFRPFEQARRRDSHGLGLWIVSQLVKAHGGRVALTSKLDEGTTVTVTLPRWASVRSRALAPGHRVAEAPR